MLSVLVQARYMGVIIVAALLVGALIMVGIGAYYSWEAIASLTGLHHAPEGVAEPLMAKLALLEAVDSFLFALVMLYFAYGTYFLVVDPDSLNDKIPLPEWLKVKNIGQMKKTLLEVIVVLLAVVFLQYGFASAEDPGWSILVFPISILALAISLKIIPFDH